jgi:hypothetical protein
MGHLAASSLGKLELDLMGSHQMTERQVLEAVVAEAIATVFEEYVEEHGLEEIAAAFRQGAKVEVGDMVSSAAYEGIVAEVPAVWQKAFELHRVRARRSLRHRADQPPSVARANGLRHGRLSMIGSSRARPPERRKSPRRDISHNVRSDGPPPASEIAEVRRASANSVGKSIVEAQNALS